MKKDLLRDAAGLSFSRERLRGGRPLFGVEKGGKDGRGGISISLPCTPP